MTSIFHKGRSRVALFAVVAMVASLMAIPLAAGAATNACPSTIPSAGFTDIGSLDQETQDAIDCIAFHDITKGTSATTYSPNDDVNRWQMALFLTRKLTTAGVTLPSGASQGFTDIGSLDAATQTAINQLAQLDITKGTTATTFDPTGIVNRWQMALFITRQLTAAGVTLPSGASQGFTDIGSLDAATQTAINQLAQLGISKGTSATTYDPTGNVNRWQMALFLSRDLDVLGVTATGVLVSVTPTSEVTLGNGSARSYTATFVNTDGSPYSGFVGISLQDAKTSGVPDYNTPAVDVTLGTVNGVTNGTGTFNGFAGTSGIVSFVVRDGAVATATDVIPVAWQDLDGDSTYENAGDDKAPTEPFGLGGITNFSATASPEAGAASFVGEVVDGKPAATNFDSTTPLKFYWDEFDIFSIKGVNKTQAEFEAALSDTDVVDVNYKPKATPSDVSIFNITTDNTAASSLKVTTPSSATSVDADNFAVKGTGDVGAAIKVYSDLVGPNDGLIAGETVLGTGTVASDGSWSVTVPLTQDSPNDFLATQKPTDGTESAPVDVPTITEGPPAAAKIAPSLWTDATPDGLNIGDVLVLNFTEDVKAPTTGDLIELVDGDGTRVSLTCSSQVTCVATDSDTITATVVLFPVIITVGSTAGLSSPAQIDLLTGFVGTDGLAVNVSGSGVNRQLTEAA